MDNRNKANVESRLVRRNNNNAYGKKGNEMKKNIINPEKNTLVASDGYVIVEDGNFHKASELPTYAYAWINIPGLMSAASPKAIYNANIANSEFSAISDEQAAMFIRSSITHIVNGALTNKVVRVEDEKGVRFEIVGGGSEYDIVTDTNVEKRRTWYPRADHAVDANGKKTGYNMIFPIRNADPAVIVSSLPSCFRVQHREHPGLSIRDMIVRSYVSGNGPKGLGNKIVLANFTVWHEGEKRQVDLFDQIAMRLAGTWVTTSSDGKTTPAQSPDWAASYF